ncbi:MAG: hypothetical protein CL927_06205 [Deltaproteobacteria bacterium]|nr:hypothetical protein [Deltaproteobacteria bacterium]
MTGCRPLLHCAVRFRSRDGECQDPRPSVERGPLAPDHKRRLFEVGERLILLNPHIISNNGLRSRMDEVDRIREGFRSTLDEEVVVAEVLQSEAEDAEPGADPMWAGGCGAWPPARCWRAVVVPEGARLSGAGVSVTASGSAEGSESNEASGECGEAAFEAHTRAVVLAVLERAALACVRGDRLCMPKVRGGDGASGGGASACDANTRSAAET